MEIAIALLPIVISVIALWQSSRTSAHSKQVQVKSEEISATRRLVDVQRVLRRAIRSFEQASDRISRLSQYYEADINKYAESALIFKGKTRRDAQAVQIAARDLLASKYTDVMKQETAAKELLRRVDAMNSRTDEVQIELAYGAAEELEERLTVIHKTIDDDYASDFVIQMPQGEFYIAPFSAEDGDEE